MGTLPNQKTITAEFTKYEMMRLAVACSLVGDRLADDPQPNQLNAKQWHALLDKIRRLIDEHDKNQMEVK